MDLDVRRVVLALTIDSIRQPPAEEQNLRRPVHATLATFCFVLFALQLSVCLWWHDYRRDDFPTLKFVVVIADLARHSLREEPFALSAAPTIRAGEPGRC